MKSLIISLVALWAIFIPSGELLGAEAARGLVLYDEPPATYVLILEFVNIRTTSVAFVTATLPDGTKQELPRSGIVAVIDYPPDTPGGSFPTDAATATQNIRAFSAKYPQCAAKLNKALTKWTNALAFFQQKQKTASVAPLATPSRGTTLEVGGVKYTDVTLKSFDGTFIEIEHTAGFARIPATKLKPEQIAALNVTSSAIHIDSGKITAVATTPPATAANNLVPGEHSQLKRDNSRPSEAPIARAESKNGEPSREDAAPLPKLGSTKSDFVKRYGKELSDKKVQNDEAMDQWLIFFKNGFSIDVFLLQGKAQVIKFIKRPLTVEEAKIILKNNAEGQDWVENNDRFTMKEWQLVRSDGNAYAFIAIRDMEYNLQNHREDEIGIVTKYVADIQAARNRKTAENNQEAEERQKQSKAARREELRKKADGL
jgi:hypothetical protein